MVLVILSLLFSGSVIALTNHQSYDPIAFRIWFNYGFDAEVSRDMTVFSACINV